MNELGLEARKLAIVLKPFVSMVVKELRPVEDEISMNLAYKSYGRRWIDMQRRAGNLTERRRGNRTMLSKAEIESVWAAETTTPQLVLKLDESNGYESIREGDKVVIRKVALKKESSKRGRKPKFVV